MEGGSTIHRAAQGRNMGWGGSHLASKKSETSQRARQPFWRACENALSITQRRILNLELFTVGTYVCVPVHAPLRRVQGIQGRGSCGPRFLVDPPTFCPDSPVNCLKFKMLSWGGVWPPLYFGFLHFFRSLPGICWRIGNGGGGGGGGGAVPGQ